MKMTNISGGRTFVSTGLLSSPSGCTEVMSMDFTKDLPLPPLDGDLLLGVALGVVFVLPVGVTTGLAAVLGVAFHRKKNINLYSKWLTDQFDPPKK